MSPVTIPDPPLAEADLAHVIEHAGEALSALAPGRLFITGGSGFYGAWLLEALAAGVDRLGLDLRATVLTRSSEAFRARLPHLASHRAIDLIEGDVRSFELPRERYSAVIHAATPASAALNLEAPLEMIETVLDGTRRALELARASGARAILLASSGAVYGAQPPSIDHLGEDYSGAPDPLDARSAYGEGKRASELLGAIAAARTGLEVKIARGFAFVGPHLPLDRHFAIGNFIRDGLAGGPIRVSGDGTPMRSYLYAGDLAVWLWTILARGRSLHAYNVGSEDARSIADVAAAVAAETGASVEVLGRPVPGAAPERYVPSTARARELGLGVRVPFADAVARTVAWHRSRRDATREPQPARARSAP